MNTLVTGGGGFIGGYLVHRLLREGHRVRVLERYTPEKEIRLSALGKRPQLTVHWTKVTHNILKNVDWVFHLAGKGGIADSIIDPLSYHRVHVDGLVNILEACRKTNIKKFLFLGSTSWYDYPPGPASEQTTPAIAHPYGLVKYLAERYIRHWGQVYGLPYVILRPFSVYGPAWHPRGSYGSVLTALLQQKRTGEPYTLIGKGTQRRDFVFVTDVVDACIRTAQSPYTHDVFNIGTGETQTILDIVKGLGGGQVISISQREKEPALMQADNTKATTHLGWKPRVLFADGMRLIQIGYDYWQKNKSRISQQVQDNIRERFRMIDSKITQRYDRTNERLQ